MGGRGNSGSRNSGSSVTLVKAGDTRDIPGSRIKQKAYDAVVISVQDSDSYLGREDISVQNYTVRRSDGKIAHGQSFTDWRGDPNADHATIMEPLSVGQKVVAWWSDRRAGILYASVANNEKRTKK